MTISSPWITRLHNARTTAQASLSASTPPQDRAPTAGSSTRATPPGGKADFAHDAGPATATSLNALLQELTSSKTFQAQGPRVPMLRHALTSLEERYGAAAVSAALRTEGAELLRAWADDGTPRFQDPELELLTLMNAVPAHPLQADTASQVVRWCLRLSSELSKVNAGHEPLLRIIQEDLAALSPRELSEAARNVSEGACPELEASLHKRLTVAEQDWARAWLTRSKSEDSVRFLRDFVFAAIEAGSTELVSAAASSPCSRKELLAVLRYVAGHFRTRTTPELEILIEGLRRGEDPTKALVQRKAAQALKDMNIDLGEVAVDPAGLESLQKAIHRVGELWVTYGLKYDADGVSSERVQKAFEESVRAVAEGRWPQARYESPASKALLACLSEPQLEVWKRRGVTGAEGDVPPDAAAREQQTRQLLTGAALALGQRVVFPEEDSHRLSSELEKLQDQLRGTRKGTARHRALSKEAGELARSVALKRLEEALATVAPTQNVDVALSRILPALREAVPALRASGQPIFQQVLDALEEEASLRASASVPRRFATDDDSLDALLCSNTTGCLAPNGSRVWGLAGALADGNTRILRVLEDGEQRYRGFVRVWEVETPAYTGPVLWLENARPDGGGGAAELELLIRHALQKADAMGIPVMSNDQYQQMGTVLESVGRAMGRPGTSVPEAVLLIREGHLNAHHSDNLMNLYCEILLVDEHRGTSEVWRRTHPVAPVMVMPTGRPA